MYNKSKFIKVRVSATEYANIVRRADIAGLNQSAYVRSQLLAVHEQLNIVDALHAIRDQMRAEAGGPSKPLVELTTEAVLLLRELIGGRDPQMLTKVRSQLNEQFKSGGRNEH
jgi:hypothetical protein